ncbi:hypothetical protein V9T40_006161 [Parthenolecanium corni]|uniref:Uncharacterized protein n=1 Tax=Parthenolecanium corni TaxID=536013 RepID=A0AAN9TXS3_9HEMI
MQVRPKIPCIFCKGDHHPHLCTDVKYNTMENRKRFLDQNKTCRRCLKEHFPNVLCQSAPKHCRWFNCLSTAHHAVVCPNVSYPIRDGAISQWYKQLGDTQAILKREAEGSESNNISSYSNTPAQNHTDNQDRDPDTKPNTK